MDLGLTRLAHRGRDVDHRAAAVAGLAAGAALMVIELIAAALFGGGRPWRVPQFVAALVMGPEALQAQGGAFDFTVIVAALATHYVLGVAFGLLLAEVLGLLPRAHAALTDAALGALFGLLLYVLNFHVLTAAAPWFVELRGAGTLAAHLAFGIVAALLYRRLRRPANP
jgi:hypothetical protein